MKLWRCPLCTTPTW